MTDFFKAVTPTSMAGRPKLDSTKDTILTGFRVTEDVHRRLVEYAGRNGVAAFLRETVVAELDRLGVVDPGRPDAEK